ncbi:MAG: cysteine--tRNA ligase [bacterium]
MEEVKFYNSLTKNVEPFEPKVEGKARIYNCGPTVYKRQHIGNMRRYLFADFLHRTLEFLGYEVKEIMNITDVGHLTEDDIDEGEDKVEKEAKSRKLSPQELAEEQIGLFFEDLKKLNIRKAERYPRASEHIGQMRSLIKKLIENGHAYKTRTGVYFDVQSFPQYGKLSGNKLKDLKAGKRIEVREEKKHPADFALWVLDNKHEQKWKSPWGVGYPGWHIECSAMSLEYLGSGIDIHTGGEDNKFPHHENEIAQAEGATGEKFVRLWLHNSHLQMAGNKLAKREGKQITLDTVEKKGYSPLAFRLLVFGSHYRSKIDFSWEALDEAQGNLETIKQLLRAVSFSTPGVAPSTPGVFPETAVIKRFGEALADDLNTPRAWAVFRDYVREINKREQKQDGLATLMVMDKVLGVIEPLKLELEGEAVPDDVRMLVDRRERARKGGDFDEADRLRQKVEKMGYKIEDTGSEPRVIKI